MAIPDLFKTKRWYLRNEDTGEVIEGQFHAEGVTLEVANRWATHTALNRAKSIIQFLNSENDKVVFQGRFYQQHFLQDIEGRLEALIGFARRNPDLGRPAVVTFWIGNGHLERTCVIDSISGITYNEPTILGALRDVTFTVNLMEYVPFSLGETEIFETRYHRGRERDYYELLCQREYGAPLLGDVIRRRHPTQPNVTPASVVKLPSIEAIRRERIEPQSVALKTAFGRADTPQRALRIHTLAARRRTYYSHVVVE